MTAPMKPWEVSMNVPIASGNKPYISNTDRLHSSANPYPGSGGGTINTPSPHPQPPPVIPPRPDQVRPIYSSYNRPSMMPYSSAMSPYSNNYSSYSPYGVGTMGLGGFSPYSNYGSSHGIGMGPYGNRMGGFGTPNYGPNSMEQPSFTQMAEESAASAFQSIESFVSAFGSISAMLDSTFQALYSSFRAVIGVADHLGRFKQILSALAVFRFFKWVIRRFLYLVGISKIKPADIESLWNNISTNDSREVADFIGENLLKTNGQKPSSWPIIMFLGFIFAGPYLMWKLIKSLNLDPVSQKEDDRRWAAGESEHFVAAAEYNFDPLSDREIPLRHGQQIRLAPAKFQPPNVKGWVLASNGVKIGLVPTTYIKVLGKRKEDGNRLQPQNVLIQSQPSVPILDNSTLNSTNPIQIISATDNMIDSADMTSDDDCETLVGEPIG